MKYLLEANKILEKLKKQYQCNTAHDELLIQQVESSVKAIKSAEEQMVNDAESLGGVMKNEPAGYGFIWSRLGDKKMHPGVTIVEKNKAIIDKCLTYIRSQPEGEEKKGKLGSMMATGGKKKKAS